MENQQYGGNPNFAQFRDKQPGSSYVSERSGAADQQDREYMSQFANQYVKQGGGGLNFMARNMSRDNSEGGDKYNITETSVHQARF